MALSTYTELKASIANFLNRSDLTTEIQDDFIKLTEADFNAKLNMTICIWYYSNVFYIRTKC